MLSLRVALRYLFSKKTHSAVNIISIVSVAGVAVATAAIVIVLSVFNGFTQISESRLSRIDPDVKALPAAGKAFANADSLAAVIAALPSVEMALPVIEERGLITYANQQMPVVFKGIPEEYRQMVQLDSTIIDGELCAEAYGYDAAQLSVGVAMSTGARPSSASVMTLYVPRRVGRINPANPSTAFRGEEVMVSGVFQVDQAEFDNDRMIIPLATARRLLEYDLQATAIEVKVAAGADAEAACLEISRATGGAVKAVSRQRLEESSFRMIQVEKWITFLMLAFILVIASFNIVSTLSLLALEKRDNMETLRSLGAPMRLVRAIFMWLGILISFMGGIAGLVLGSALVLIQQWGKVVKLGGDPAQMSIHYYPVRLEGMDLLTVLALVAVVAAASAAIGVISSKK